MSKIWSPEEDLKLRSNYQLKKLDLLSLFPNRSPAAINCRASILGLKKEQNEYRNCDLSTLLSETALAYYWIGFILADGCFSGVNSNRLIITLKVDDFHHLYKLATVIKTDCNIIAAKSGYSLRTKVAKLSAQDKLNSPKIREKFDIKSAKTYHPPEFIPTSDKELCMSLLAGLIDGDGNIGKQHGRQKHLIRIKCHASWQKYYEMLNDLIFIKSNSSKIQNSGYYVYSIYKQENIRLLLETLSVLNIPLMKRKWLNLFNEYGLDVLCKI